MSIPTDQLLTQPFARANVQNRNTDKNKRSGDEQHIAHENLSVPADSDFPQTRTTHPDRLPPVTTWQGRPERKPTKEGIRKL